MCNYEDCWIWNVNNPCCDDTPNASLIINDSTNTTQLKILLNLEDADQIAAYNDNKPLIVDYPITGPINVPNYSTISIPADTFYLQSDIGDYGGYLIPVTLN